jgi:hypothetical protein
VDNLSISRTITHIQIHHTWKPRKIDYKGESTIRGMWNYHTKTRGWNDIAQHVSVAPDGLLWDGRSLEDDPAGIAGHNDGGFMFEIIGDFDEGKETLDGVQLYAVTKATSLLLKKFNLSYSDIVFHREHASKSCPGTGISKDWFIELVKRSDPVGKVSEVTLKAKKTTVIDEKDGREYESFIIDGRTYAPVRSIAQSAGRQVHWNGKNVILK